VCETTTNGISITKKITTTVESNDLRASAYGIAGAYVKDNDPIAMYKAAEAAVARARNGQGPTIIEIETYRFLGHFQGDPELYRDQTEVPGLRQMDPLLKLRKMLAESESINETDLETMEKRAKQEVDEAYQFARDSSYPDPESALKDVFSS